MDQKYLLEISAKSEHKAAKWITDLDTNLTYYWPAGDTSHAAMAKNRGVLRYDKGIVIEDHP